MSQQSPDREPAPVAASHTGSRPRAAGEGGDTGAGAGTGTGHGAFVPGQTGAAVAPPPLPPEQRARLDAAFAAVMVRGMHGLCFSPYLEGQQPGSQIGEAQIRERLAVVRPHTRWVRSFSCTDGHEQTPRIAHEMGLKTLVGAWLGTDAAINERELEGVIAVARAGQADIVAVGNEVLLREDLGEDELIACIERVKQALPGVPVGYVDAYFLFEKHPRVTAACDVVMTNCYPFWEGCPREQALPYMQQMLAKTRAAAPGKRVLISETGWPDRGSAFHGAVPGHEAAMQYFVDSIEWAEREGIEIFWFSAFDEAWKVGAEGDVGAYWGLWDKDARLKFG
ncbi:MAG: glycosyl hydrolase [Rubrivivax sp.]|nr:glycosyl hydrolase [Rubrivivax sp.]